MLHETYKRNIRTIREKNPNAIFVDVTKTSNSSLAPSLKLADQLREKKITWAVYSSRFRDEMNTPSVQARLLEIAEQAVTDDIYLLCYEAKAQTCHRIILMDMIEEIAKANDIDLKIEKPIKSK